MYHDHIAFDIKINLKLAYPNAIVHTPAAIILLFLPPANNSILSKHQCF